MQPRQQVFCPPDAVARQFVVPAVALQRDPVHQVSQRDHARLAQCLLLTTGHYNPLFDAVSALGLGAQVFIQPVDRMQDIRHPLGRTAACLKHLHSPGLY